MELRDERIVLRPWCEADAQWVYESCQDPEIQRWLPMLPRPYTKDDAWAFVTDAQEIGAHRFAIVEGARPVGSIRLGERSHETGFLGYWCSAEARGRGLVTRATRTLCRFGLDELELERLELTADVDNLASQRVAEKVGFRREGVMRAHMRGPDGPRRDSILYSLLPGELR